MRIIGFHYSRPDPFISDWGDTATGIFGPYFFPNEEDFSEILIDTVGGYITDALGDMTIKPVDFDMMLIQEGSDIQEMEIMQNEQNILANRIQGQTANNFAVGLAIGIAALEVNDSGGNGDDLILDASLNAAATLGVDSAGDIYGEASNIEDQ